MKVCDAGKRVVIWKSKTIVDDNIKDFSVYDKKKTGKEEFT